MILDKTQYEFLCARICRGDACMLEDGREYSLWRVQHGDRQMYAVLEKRRRIIVTFLPNRKEQP